MKCLKVEDYVKRTACPNKTRIVCGELESYVRNGPGAEGRMLCDRVIRACNQQLGAVSLSTEHLDCLMGLVEIAIHGYESSRVSGLQSDTLYMEKILFHILKKVAVLGSQTWCQFLGDMLYEKLALATVTADYHLLARSCFAVLWSALTGARGGDSQPSPDCKLADQLKTVRFLLLLDPQGHSKVAMHAEDAVMKYVRACGVLREDGARHLLEQIRQHLFGPGQLGADRQSWPTLCEVSLQVCRHLCKAGLWHLAAQHLERDASWMRGSPCLVVALDLACYAIGIHSASRGQCGVVLAKCARGLQVLPGELGRQERHAVLQGCQLLVWVLEGGQLGPMAGPTLLAWFSFLEEYQKLLEKHMQMSTGLQMEQKSYLQQTLCYSLQQGLMDAYDSLAASQLEEARTLERVLLYCQSAAGRLVSELQKLAADSTFAKAASAISSLACGLYNRKLYNQAFSLAEILCQELRKNSHPSLPVEKLNRAFMLAIQSSRRDGQLERALDWVVHWLQALGDQVLDHMAEPVSLWAKTKADAARAGQEDTRLRTLCDGLGQDAPREEVMICLLEEELHAYREVAGNTAQERYNVLCDLLDVCHEGSAHTLARAVYLCEMAQVVCFQDFSEQTDSSAVDFTQEALRLLEEEPETTENSDRLKDHKAQALLWFYICTLEKNLQEAIEREQRLAAAREQSRSLEPLGTNDLDYEDKLKQQDSQQVYESLRFNLMAQSKQCQSLDRALELWRGLLAGGSMPAVRSTKRMLCCFVLMGALYRLMGKPLQALESYQLAVGLSRATGDTQTCAIALCHATRLLLELGAPELAQMQLVQAEQLLQLGSPSADGPAPLEVQAVLLRTHLCLSTGQVELGVSLLNQVLKEVGGQRQSKTWYLLRARALQVASSYLSLGVSVLPHHLRQRITHHGLKTADAALYESLKLLCSLVVTLVGNGFYGANSAGADTCFVDQGDNVLLKWQLLSEVLSCSQRVVAMRSHSGAVHEAKVQCLEALKLATKLQTLSQCAELLVVKAELELQRAELGLSGMDLEQVKDLLDVCIDFSSTEKNAGVKIKLQKGRLSKKPHVSAGPSEEEDYSSMLSTRAFPLEPVETTKEWGLSASPPLKPKPQSLLSSLGHAADCDCPCCSDPWLGRVVVRWAAAHAELLQRQEGPEGRSHRLFLTALSRSKAATAKLGTRLLKLMAESEVTGVPQPSFLHDLTANIYLRMALASLEPQTENTKNSGELLESGLAFMDSQSSPELALVHAGLQAAKALASILALASKRGCRPDELFSPLWTWNPLASPKHKPKPFPLAKKTKEPNTQEIKKARELATGTTMVPKLKITFPSCKSKTTKTVVVARAPPDEARTFDFDDEVPKIAMCTPVQKVCPTRPARGGAAKPGHKHQFQVFDESSPVQDKLRPVPAAPKRSKRSRFKVEFSDESDVETDAPAQAGLKNPRSKTSSTASKPSARTPGQTARPKRPGRPKKSTAAPADTASSADDNAPSRSAPRRGRPRKSSVPPTAACEDELERMRTIKEEAKQDNRGLDMSVQEVRASDTEEQEVQDVLQDVLVTDFEVLRREPVLRQQVVGLGEIRGGGHSRTPTSHPTYPNTGSGDLSLDMVRRLLRAALQALQHLPPPSLYPHLCGLLALCLGQSDPVATAMLHAQSLGLTARHHMIRHLSTRLGKLRKAAAPDLTSKLRGLSLDDPSTHSPLQQRLAQLETIFAFPTLEPTAFPHQPGQEFTQQLQSIPPGVTVCLLSVASGQFGEMGDTILLSRLERSSPPITVRIPTAQREWPVSAVLQEMDSVQKQQKVVSSVADKAEWWEGRRALDQRMERLLEEMKEILGGWLGLLLPLTSDPELCFHAKALMQTLTEYGVQTTEETLKAVLSASPLLSPQDLHSLASGLCPCRMEESLAALQGAVSALKDRAEPQGHIVLMLDKYLQKLPWENISSLRSHTVTRMPSLHFLLGHCALKELDPESVLNGGVDPQQVYYVLNPDANLKDTEERFKEWFTSESAWQGVCGTAPSPDQLQEAVATKDLYIYVGHGAGARFLDSRRLLKQDLRAAALLFGCSSAALAVHGELEGAGIILNYLMAGCPLILGNLWDVTDRDIDRFTKALLQSWLSAGRGAALLDHMASSRQATYLKHLIGAAPVVYGLPVSLK